MSPRRILLTLAVTFFLSPLLAEPGLAGDPPRETSDPTLAQDDRQDPPPPRRRPRRPTRAVPEKPSEKKEPEEKKEPDRWLAVVGGTIHTVTDGRIDDGTILVKNGRIHEIGSAIPVPPDAEVIPAAGFHVYPGLVAINSTRLVSTPDNTDVYSWSMELALAGGITTARTRTSVVKLTYGTLEGHSLRKTPFVSLSYTTVKARRDLRDAFERIREYQREKERLEEEKKKNPELKELDRKWIRGLFSTAEQLMDGKKVALARASTAHQIRQLCDLARRYDFQLVIERAEEGWIVPGELARANASAIITPRARRDRSTTKNAPNGSSIENARILHEHGIPIAIFPVGSMFAPGGGVSTSGLAGRDMLNLPLEAAFAVRGGLPEDAAVRAITLDAAHILGVEDRVGSIEVGKDADFVITDGDLLYYLTQSRWTVVNGRIAYDKEKSGILSHIRPGGEDTPAVKDAWPRRLGDPF